MNKKSILILSVIIILGGVIFFETNKIMTLLYPRKYSIYVEKYADEYEVCPFEMSLDTAIWCDDLMKKLYLEEAQRV